MCAFRQGCRLLPAKPPHMPVLTSTPNAWVLALKYTAGGFDAPGRIAFDAAGNVWSTNNFEPPTTTAGLGLTVLSPTGRPILNSPRKGGGVYGAGFGIAIDARNRVWIGNVSGSSISLFSNAGVPLSPSATSTPSAATSPAGASTPSAWTAGFGSRNVFEIASNGTIAPASPFAAPSMHGPWGVAVDGDDNVWVADFTGMNVIELCGRSTAHCPPGLKTGAQLSPQSSGFTSAGLQHLTAVQIDSSGNVWVTNNVQTPGSNGEKYAGGDGLVEFIGLAAPVKTPLIGLPQRP